MAILIDMKKSNVIHIEDYLDNRPNRIRRPLKDFNDQIANHQQSNYIPFSDELADLNRQIAKHKRETDIIDREIAEYHAEAEENNKKLKEKLFSVGERNGKD